MTTAKLTLRRDSRFIIGLLCVVYFASYFSRLDYATVLAEIIVSEGLLKSDAALVTTACFITYGVGQLISGWLGDRISPKWLIFTGLSCTAVLNFLMPLCGSVGLMAAVWGANGLAQAMLWPPMVRLMAGYLDADGFAKGCVNTSIASSAATIALYLLAPGLITLGGWRGVFRAATGLSLLTAAAWLLLMTLFEKKHGAVAVGSAAATALNTQKEGDTAGVSMRTLIFSEGLLFAMVGIIMQGILRDGVTTWLPSYLVEVFHLETGSSILSSVIIPIFSIFSFWACATLNRRLFKNNEVRFSVVLFLVGGVLSLAMAALFNTSAVCSALLAALLTACMHGVNLMLICNLPARFASTGKVSLISGVLNACTYIGSAVSTYGFALIAQGAGWQATVLCWAGVCLVGAGACVVTGHKAKALLQAPVENS